MFPFNSAIHLFKYLYGKKHLFISFDIQIVFERNFNLLHFVNSLNFLSSNDDDIWNIVSLFLNFPSLYIFFNFQMN